MDKATNERKKIEEGVEDKPKLFSLRVSSERFGELQKMLGEIDQDYTQRKIEIEKRLKSFWSDKPHYELLKWIVETDYYSNRSTWITNYAINCLETRLSNIEAIVQGITEKVKIDLSSLKSEVEALRKAMSEPAFTEVAQLARSIKESIEKSKLAGEEYVE